MNKQTVCHSDILLASAGSLYSVATIAITDIVTAVLAYGPATLTIMYLSVKIFYKIKRESESDRFKRKTHRKPQFKEDEDD